LNTQVQTRLEVWPERTGDGVDDSRNSELIVCG
jgi:hypothetical protein